VSRRPLSWRLPLAVLALAALAWGAARAQAPAARPSPEELAAHLRQYVPTVMQEWQVPGLAMAVVAGDRVVYSGAFGLRDVERRLPVTPETLFAIGSATKAFTTLALGTLVDEGKLDWDEPVRAYLPEFQLRDPFASERMTARDLVTHRSGLPRHDLAWYGSPLSRAELFRRLAELEPSADFRTRFQYQNLMFMTAGFLAEKVSGRSWEALVRERILAPLGMRATDFSIQAMQAAPDHARAYRRRDEGVGIEEMPLRNVDAVGPAGSINSSVLDMASWVRLHLGDGTFGGRRVVSRATLEELHAPQVVIREGALPQLLADDEQPYLLYGLGWFVQPWRGRHLIQHGGNIDGFTALVSFLPREKLGLVILTNLDNSLLPYAVAFHTYDRLLGLPEKDWDGLFKAKRDAVETATAQRRRAAEAERKKGTRPAHPLDEYAGVYTHPAYGELRVERDGKGGLRFACNGLAGGLEHWNYEVWNVTDGPARGTKLTFLTDTGGDVDRVTAPFEASVADIVFTRKPPASLEDPEGLRRYAGEYELNGQIAVVALTGDKLTVSVPGQRAYELVPHRQHEFDVKGLRGYGVRFLIEGGQVTGLSFVQPNGVFPAKRRPGSS
jgi:CubicO group peptidase (beta-lactamase class C family)